MDSDTETPSRTLVRKVSTTEESISDLSETGRYFQVVQEQGAGVQAIAIMVQCGGRLWYRCLSDRGKTDKGKLPVDPELLYQQEHKRIGRVFQCQSRGIQGYFKRC